jgi:hypothetical protein
MLSAQKIVYLAFAVLLLLHFDFWNWDQIHPIVFGWMPIGLFYHVAYTFVFAALLIALNKFCWPDPPKGYLKEDEK